MIPPTDPATDEPPPPRLPSGWRPRTHLVAAASLAAVVIAASMDTDFFVGALVGFALLAWFLAVPASVAVALRRRSARLGRLSMVYGAFLLLTILLMGTLSTWCKSTSIDRGNRIAAALDRYHAEHAAFPDRLTELVPHDLPAIPAPAMNPFRDLRFHYWRYEPLPQSREPDYGYALSFDVGALDSMVRTAITDWRPD